MSKKVTIMTSCYNGETYVIPHLESILSQDYDNIEYIFVNDGSTDKTEEIVKDYKHKFEEKNIDFKYIYKENGGQASGINQALKILSGEYVSQIDSDDIILPNYISELTKFLEENKDCGFCCPTVKYIYKDYLNKKFTHFFKDKIQQRILKDSDMDSLFYDLISGNKNIPHCSFIMYRTKELLDVLMDGQISEKYQTQVEALIIPMSYAYKAGYLDKVLAYYVYRKNSHGHNKKVWVKIADWEGTMLEAILRLKTTEYEKNWAYSIIKTRWAEHRHKRLESK